MKSSKSATNDRPVKTLSASKRQLAGERILLTFWVGSLWTIGYIVAPTLFARLEDHALAGSLAGVLFHIIAWLGLVCGSLLLLSNQWRYAGRRFNWRAVVLVLMLLLVAVGEFVLTPAIAEMRQLGATESADFKTAHGIAASLYLLTSLLGLLLVAAASDSA